MCIMCIKTDFFRTLANTFNDSSCRLYRVYKKEIKRGKVMCYRAFNIKHAEIILA